jgi:hypothetical protein
VAARKERQAKQEKSRLVFTLERSESSSLASSFDRPPSPTFKKYPFQSDLTTLLAKESPSHPHSYPSSLTAPTDTTAPPAAPPAAAADATISGDIIIPLQQHPSGDVNKSPPVVKGRNPPPAKTPSSEEKGNTDTKKTKKTKKTKNTLGYNYTPVFNEVITAANEMSDNYNQSMQSYETDRDQFFEQKHESNAFMDQWKGNLIDELNLYVDPTFSKARTYGDAVNMIIYYVYVSKTKVVIKHWKRWLKETNRALRIDAAALLTRVARGMLARKEVYTMKENIRLQKEAEALEIKRRYIFSNFMSRRISKCYKKYKKRCLFLWNKARKEAATTIQSQVRIMLAKRRVVRIIEWNALCYYSATKIQVRWRMLVSKRILIVKRKIEYVHQWELSLQEKKLLQRVHYRHHGASLALSRVYRAHTIHKRLQTILYWNRFNMALRIQAFYRGHRARCRCAQLRADIVRMKRIRLNAVIRIEAWCRRHLAKKIYQEKLDKKVHKAKKRKKRKKKKLKDFVIPIAGDLKLNVSSCNRSIRKTVRSNIPFRYMFERRKAITIQRYYRGFHGRKRVMILKIMRKMEDLYGGYAKRVKSVIIVQKIFRGHQRRREMRKELWKRMSVKIQCYWRRRAAKRVVFHMRQKIAALVILDEKLSSLLMGKKVRDRYLVERKYRRNICVVQRLIRKYLGRKHFREMKDTARVHLDSQASAELTAMKVISAVELMILKESMERDIMVKFTTASGLKCPCLGPIQALYLFACGKRARYDPSQLASNRLDASNLSKFLAKIDVIIHSEKKGKPRKIKSVDKTNLTVLKAIKLGLVKLPKIVNKLKSTDIDVLFNRHKDPGGGSVLQYLEFSDMLRGCAGYNNDRGVLEQIPIDVSRFISFRERISRFGLGCDENESSSLCSESRSAYSGSASRSVYSAGGGSRGESKKGSRGAVASREANAATMIPNQQSFEDLFFQDTNASGLKRHYLGLRKALDGYLYDIENLRCNRETLGIPVALIMMMSLEHEKWVEPVFRWITAESHARIASFVVPIQCLIRLKLANVAVRRRRVERNIENQERKTMQSIRMCQGVIRRRLQWQRIVKIAQKVLVKYIPHKGNPYWFNPRTRVTSYEKPKILGSYACKEVPLPGPNLEYVIKCGICEEKEAEVNCDQCEDSMCKTCFSTMHCKGKRQLHTYSPIPHCALCKYQNATKSCMTCSLRKPEKGSLMSLVDGERGVLCDTCYTYVHDGCNSTSAVVTKKLGNDNHCGDHCKDAYLIQLEMNQRLDTDHRYSALVQFCEECQWRAASYRCSDCDQVYCSKCLKGYHSIGGPFASHTAEKLPYYTPDMHKKFERAIFAQRLQRRIEKVAQQFAKAALKKKVKCCIYIQSWWRMMMFGIPAREFLKEGRLKERRMFKVRRIENLAFRKKISYKIKDFLGVAPILKSDTLEEQTLKRHSIFRREKIRHFIYPNCDDWGFLQQKSLELDPPIEPTQKGSPRKGFDFGTPDELRDQAKYGGYRICGRINMKMGETQHDVDRDLSKFVKRGMLLRIGTAFFGVANFTEKTITLNRRWRFASKNGCIMYRLPCLKNDRYKAEYKYRMKLFDIFTGNPICQGYLKTYEFLYEFGAKKARERAVEEKKAGFMAQSKKWNMIADRRDVKAGWAKNMIFQEGGPMDLANPDGTEKVDPSLNARARRCVPANQRVPGEEWEANREESNARDARELKMDDPALALEAHLWEEKLDVLRNRPYWVHRETKEYFMNMPRAVRAEKDEEKKKKVLRKQFAEQQKKLGRMKKK